MIANVNKNNSKLVAAIVAMAMIVCAIAVVAMPTDAATAGEDGKPTMDFTECTPVTVDAVDKLTTSIGFDSTTGVLTITKDTVLNITGTVGSASAPAIKQIILNGGDLQITGIGTIYIANDAAKGSTIVFGADGGVLSITGGVIVDVDSKGDESFTINNGDVDGIGEINNNFHTALVSVTNGAELIVRHTGSGNSTWYNADAGADKETYLDVDNATVNFSNATSVQGVVLTATDGAQVIVDEGRSSGIVLKAGSTITDSTVKSTAAYAGILVKGNIVLDNSTVTAQTSSETYYGIEFSVAGKGLGTDANAPGFTLENGSSVSADTYGFSVEYGATTTATEAKVSISGQGTVTGTFNGIRNGESVTSETYTVDGVTLSNVEATAEGVSTTIGANGVVVDGTFETASATVTDGATIIVASGSASLPNTVTTEQVYVTEGATATIAAKETGGDATTVEYDEKKSVSVKSESALATAASAENAKVTLGANIPLTSPLALASGVEIVGGEYTTTVTQTAYISATNATYNGKVIGGSSTATLNITGTYTVKSGSVAVDGSISGSIAGEGSAEVKITGTIDGDLIISGKGTVEFTDVTVSPNADVTLGDGITYNINNKFYLYGALLVTTPYTGAGITMNVNSNGEFKAFPNATISPSIAVAATDGATNVTIDLGEAMGIQYIRQDVTSNLNYSQTQTVIIEESIFIKKGATLTVLGQLIVNENVDVIIEEGGRLVVNNQTAKVTINGDIEVENGGSLLVTDADTVDISGTVTSDGTLTVNSNVTVKEGGSILVQNGDKSVFTVSGIGAKLVIDAGGNVEIRGQADVSDITNKGTVTLNGAVLSGDVKISMAADGAVVDIKSFTSGKTASKLEITDYGLIFKDSKTATEVVKVDGVKYTANTLTVDGEAYGGIRGLVISESVTSETKNKVTTYYNSFVLSGSIGIADESTNTADEVKSMVVSVNGPSIDVAETLTIAKNVTLKLTLGNLDVAGTITATAEGATVEATDGNINVSGMIETCVEIDENINAFSYEGTLDGDPVWYYTTLKTAIDNGQTDILAHGTTSVLESVDIPAETTVKADTDHKLITIGSTDARDVVVTVKDGGEIRSCVIDVMGTLTFDNKRNDRGNTITSDVYVEDEVSKSYTNIYTALNNAQSGETVTIYRSGSNVVLDKDVTIKTGVTLDIPSGKGVTVNDTVTVTVDGTLKLSGNLVAQNVGFNPDVDNHSTIDVNGAFMAVGEIVYADDVVSTVDYYIPGAYYNLVNTSGNWNYVTPIEQAAAVSNDVTGGEIEIWGENQVGEVAFTGDDDVEVTIDLYGKLNASNLKLTYATFNVGAGYQFDGTVSSDAGSVQIVNASNFVVESIVDEDATTVMSISGTPAQVDDKGADAKVTIATGNVSVLNANAEGNDFVVTGVEFAISEGATLTVAESNAVLYAKELAVNGTLVATNGGKVIADKVYIIGTFTVAVADNDNGILAGSADVKEVRVGLSSDFETTSAATLNAEKLNGWTAIYVSAESTVTEKLIENATSTQFFVEDALWFTVYGNGNNVSTVAPGVIPTEDVLLEQWTGVDANDKIVPVKGGADFIIGSVERLDAKIIYDIYTVTVFADPGITAVYIDGKLMTSGVFMNGTEGVWNEGFRLTVAAGEHEITYKLGTYFSGEAKMTVNGESVTGNTFTTSGMPDKDANGNYEASVDYIVYLQGIDASEPVTPSTGGDDGMGLTDYLLIVLVVLIVIMAIMVALRLMRS